MSALNFYQGLCFETLASRVKINGYCDCFKYKRLNSSILTNFNYARLTSHCIFQMTVECNLPLLRLCHHELVSSANT